MHAMRHCLPIIVGLAVSLVPVGTEGVAQTSCMMPESFSDPHRVIHDTQSLVWVRPLNVDADGAPNAYHRDDPHGRKGLAIEYLGNGMTISRDGEDISFEPDERDNSQWLEAYKKIVRNGWEAPGGYSVDIYGFAVDEAGRVCVTKQGRLISSTSLVLNPLARRCDPRRYLDATKFPGIVVPNRESEDRAIDGDADPEVAPPFAERGVRRGDLAVVYNPETKIWKGAFLYDTGPRRLLGEGSIRLVMNLRGIKRVPKSGDETNSMALAESFTVLFPGSVSDLGPRQTWTPEKIERAAAARFKQWGGGTEEGALQRLLSCADEYKSESTKE
jgi:hypothetical protein